ncbi:vitamin K epoxide reductase family protein [Candidatus Saccharibacteria bacterium oral taxon 488]|jgi:vitamin K epoxide reductase|nr:vitamin K epoxide reductase family protein [Candidatus Saccharibacteria bacterium oral taxon 488]QLF51618.1 vitamin K epoxide reductase family protein [Candidatus Saccharibacteria bacterium oral taxon 488]
MFDMLRKWLSNKDSKRRQFAVLALLLGSGLGLLASFVLSIEALTLAKNSHAALNCDLNSVISCSAVANHWSATLLGFPNSFIGVMTLPVMVTIAVALLAGAKLPKWFMWGAQLGAVAGLLFAGWMFYMSYVEIGALCPWCLTLDAGMLLVCYGLTRYNVVTRMVGGRRTRKFVDRGFDTFLLALVTVVIVVVILATFGRELFA